MLGTIIGIIWGSSSKFDNFLIFIKGMLDNTPIIFFYIIIITSLGNNFMSLLLVIIMFGWVSIACLVRNNLLIIRNRDYNIASKLYKTPLLKRAIHQYIPSILPIIFNSMALCIPDVIAFEITLSYFGFSMGESSISLGKLLFTSLANNNAFTHPYLFLIPFVFLFIINLCFHYIGKTISAISTKEGVKNVKS